VMRRYDDVTALFLFSYAFRSVYSRQGGESSAAVVDVVKLLNIVDNTE